MAVDAKMHTLTLVIFIHLLRRIIKSKERKKAFVINVRIVCMQRMSFLWQAAQGHSEVQSRPEGWANLTLLLTLFYLLVSLFCYIDNASVRTKKDRKSKNLYQEGLQKTM